MSTNPPRDGILVRNLLINSNCRKKLTFRFPIVASLSMKAIKKNFFLTNGASKRKPRNSNCKENWFLDFAFQLLPLYRGKYRVKYFFYQWMWFRRNENREFKFAGKIDLSCFALLSMKINLERKSLFFFYTSILKIEARLMFVFDGENNNKREKETSWPTLSRIFASKTGQITTCCGQRGTKLRKMIGLIVMGL